MVKVGDKVMIVSGGGSHVGYENGDVLEVIAFSTRNPKDIYVRILKDVGYTGRSADRPICQPFAFLIEPEYEVVEEKPKAEIKLGDTVKLIDKFYEHEKFKGDKRPIRKQIASLKGKELEVKYISKTSDRVEVGGIDYYVPIELLEKAEQLPKPGDLFKVVGKGNNYHNFELGEIVEFLNVDPSGMFELRGYIKNRGEVGDQILYKSDIEPYTKHSYTADQIAEAQRIIGEIVAVFPNGISLKFRKEGAKTYTYVDGVNFGRFAICAKTDEYNQTIGRMITLCKHVGRPLPEWL
jgi:hypothetical protein